VRRFLYDTAVFVYAVGGTHAYREPCQAIVERAAAGALDGEASIDLLQEFAHQRFRQTRDRRAAADAALDVARLCRLHDLRREDVMLGLRLYRQHDRLTARDASFAAVALNRAIRTILSPDRAFDVVDGLERVDPADGERVAALGLD
jgi:predicted nucleic acid-binding protein